MTYSRDYAIDAAPGGDTVLAAIGTKIDGDLTKIFTDLTTHETMTTNAHGVGAGTICGTTLTQTLTNKTLTSPTITGGTATNMTLATPTVTGAMNLASGQITFPATQNASAGANVLDDYEENTWVAAFAAGTGTITINSSYDEGSYVKIGKCVNILGTFKVTSVSSPDAEFTLSLPMSSGATPDITIIPVVVTGLASNSFTGFYGRIDSSAPDVVTIVGKTAGGDDATIANYVQADTTVVVGGGYFV